jgi:hypothetical protein
MSFEFSRRNFMKYTAVAAVALAGASLFTGCKNSGDSYNLLKEGAGELTVLQVTAAMGNYDDKSKKYTAPDITGTTTTIEFPMKITNNRTNPIYVTPNNFKVVVTSSDGKTVKKYSVTIDDDLKDTNLKKGSSVYGNVKTAQAVALKEGDVVVLTYCPDLQYNEYSLNWKLTVSKSENTSTSGTT